MTGGIRVNQADNESFANSKIAAKWMYRNTFSEYLSMDNLLCDCELFGYGEGLFQFPHNNGIVKKI